MKILVTGFNPFGKESINPAIEVVKRLPDEINGNQIIKLEIPTKFNTSAQVVKQKIKDTHPDYVLDIGQAGGRKGITPELVAININDGGVKDNAGYRPFGEPIQADGQTAYFTELPIKAIVNNVRRAGLPSKISTTAGTYVCNHIMYQVQYLIDHEFPHLKAGFIHVPFLPEQVQKQAKNYPALTLKDDIKGITVALKTIIQMDGQKDITQIKHAYNY